MATQVFRRWLPLMVAVSAWSSLEMRSLWLLAFMLCSNGPLWAEVVLNKRYRQKRSPTTPLGDLTFR